MIKTPGRKPQSSSSRKNQLSSDAKIIITLIKKQPQTKEEICSETKTSIRNLYRIISFLEGTKIIKCVDHEYALWNFNPLETEIKNAFFKLRKWPVFTSDNLVNETMMPWNEIEHLSLEVAKKIGATIELKDGKYKFYLPKIWNNE